MLFPKPRLPYEDKSLGSDVVHTRTQSSVRIGSHFVALLSGCPAVANAFQPRGGEASQAASIFRDISCTNMDDSIRSPLWMD